MSERKVPYTESSIAYIDYPVRVPYRDAWAKEHSQRTKLDDLCSKCIARTGLCDEQGVMVGRLQEAFPGAIYQCSGLYGVSME
jgi:hypothetical protein